ncbi:MAG: YfcE family phosphodiesterase [Planctomycetota bacterium]
MKIGVISDTHDRLPTFRRALQLFARLEVAAVFHAGDLVAPFAAKLLTPEARLLRPAMFPGSVHVIYGNNDGERDGLKKILPQIADGPLRVTLDTPGCGNGKTTVAMAHFIEWFKPADLAGADVVISGHDHTPAILTRPAGDREVLFINPGECCGWVNDRCTVALMDLSGPKPTAELIDVKA